METFIPPSCKFASKKRRSDRLVCTDKYVDFLIKRFEVDIEKNDIEYTAALLYAGSTLSSFLFQLVERNIGLILILSSAIALLYVLGTRERIKERYERHIRAVLTGQTYMYKEIETSI